MSEVKHSPGDLSIADQQKLKAGSAHAPKPDAGPEPKTFGARLDAMFARLDAAARDRDGDELGRLYDEAGGLKPSNPTEEVSLRAFARKLHHLAPRKLVRIREIEAALDAATSGKKAAAAPPPEHPAVTQARRDLADLDALHEGHVEIPGDREALDALRDKMAKVKPPAD